ncbi:LCP family protein [Candidatus Saccharibacteria bacterium]|nr:LCP family protein [Candidatus Saccharibacteria bacterium]
MGNQAAASKVDQIDKIEQSLYLETAKLKKSKKISEPSKTKKDHARTEHPFVVSAVSALIIVAIPVLLYYRYFGLIDNYLKSVTSFSEETNGQNDDADGEKEQVSFGNTPLTFYISGSDSRVGVSDTNARSDVNIIAVVNPTTSKVLLVSTPRDYYIQLHGTTGLRDKLTHAGIYGIDMSRQTMEDLLDISVNHTIKVSFDALTTVVDTLGGIDVYSDRALSLSNGRCNLVAGTQHINGECALAFSRERYSYETGDRHRGQNQQQVISKILEKATTPAYLLRLPEILSAADGLFETSLTYSEILSIIKYQVLSNANWKFESISLDGIGAMLPTYSTPSQDLYVMIPNEDSISAAHEKITEYLKTKSQLEEELRQEEAEPTKVATEGVKAKDAELTK